MRVIVFLVVRREQHQKKKKHKMWLRAYLLMLFFAIVPTLSTVAPMLSIAPTHLQRSPKFYTIAKVS
jgi:hypothetical protein